MTTTDAVNHLLNIAIKGQSAYHPGYAETVEYAKTSRAHFAGVDIDDYLKRFTRRESHELYEQRKEITAHINRSIGAMLDRPFAKAPRSNWTKVIAFDGDDKGIKSQQFQRETLGMFTDVGLNGYVFDRCRYFSKYDPNTFVVIEFDAFDNNREKAKPYPFEVTSDMAVDFQYSQYGQLSYLVARQVHQKMDGQSIVPMERLTMYMPKQTVVIQQLTKVEQKQYPAIPSRVKQVPNSEVVDGQIINTGEKVFVCIIPIPHGLDVTPAIRVGHIENPKDAGRTRIGIFDAALPFAQKVVKINSELDIVTAFLAFPVSIRHEERCDQTGCLQGKLPDGTTCVHCSGSGYKKRPTSAAEEIVLPLPDRAEDMLDVTKILHYAYPPTEAVKMQIELMQYYIQQAKESVFNSEMFSKQETSQTATYHGIALQSVYDTLYPYAQNIARIWHFIAEACRVFTGIKEPMTAAMIFPHDFRFETADDLFNELKQARDAGAGADTNTLLQERIMERLLIDDEERLNRWRIDNQFDPFRGMSEAQILTALNSELVPKWKKVWYINRAEIMSDILQENPAFYQLAYSKQRELIMSKVDELAASIAESTPALNIGAIGDNNPKPNAN